MLDRKITALKTQAAHYKAEGATGIQTLKETLVNLMKTIDDCIDNTVTKINKLQTSVYKARNQGAPEEAFDVAYQEKLKLDAELKELEQEKKVVEAESQRLNQPLYLSDENTAFSNHELCRPEFCCPITNLAMIDPVMNNAGITYEREAIQKWYDEGHNTDPSTRIVIDKSLLLPNIVLRSMIEAARDDSRSQPTKTLAQ